MICSYFLTVISVGQTIVCKVIKKITIIKSTGRSKILNKTKSNYMLSMNEIMGVNKQFAYSIFIYMIVSILD